MRDLNKWNFAHKYIGKLWFYLGLLLIPITVIPMLFVLGGTEDVVGTMGCIICVIALIILIVPIFPTERALKMNFDKDGNRKA